MKAQSLLITAVIIFNGACKPIPPASAPATTSVPATVTATAPETKQIASAPNSAESAAPIATSPVAANSLSTPKAPDLMAPSRHGAEITFSWSNPAVTPGGADIVSYNLQIASPGVNNADPVILFSGNVTGLSKTVTGLNGQRYFAKVQAVDARGNTSEFSAASQGVIVDTENPADPTGLRVITQSDPAGVLVTLEWQESHDNVTAAPNMTYYACSSTNGADISTLATCLSSATPAELPSIKGRASIQLRKSAAEATGVMSFRVIAQDEAGNKSISNILLAQFVTPNLSPAD